MENNKIISFISRWKDTFDDLKSKEAISKKLEHSSNELVNLQKNTIYELLSVISVP